MVRNLSEQEIFDFIVSDFEGAWNSVADKPDKPGEKIGRGNLMFASQAMNLLEFAARLYSNDSTGQIHTTFSKELNKIEPKYFTLLPSPCVATNTEFTLPHMGDTTGRTLLWVLFDLIRNGLAHQYQQIIVDLNDKNKNRFCVSLAIGAEYKRSLSEATRSRPVDHLAYSFDSSGDLMLKIYPDILFLDFKDAIISSKLLHHGLLMKHLSRPKGSAKYYNFDRSSLENSLVSNKHPKI
jgi:hypothetical protein